MLRNPLKIDYIESPSHPELRINGADITELAPADVKECAMALIEKATPYQLAYILEKVTKLFGQCTGYSRWGPEPWNGITRYSLKL